MLQVIIDWMFYSLCNLSPESRLVESLNFFVYDSIKILLLLFLLIAIIGFVRSYLSEARIKSLLKRTRCGHLSAACLGAITPFCSCSSIPIFLSMVKAGIPLGMTLSFLITSPLVNEYVVVIMLGLFGWKITLAYVVFGIIVGTIGGWVLGACKLERYLEKDIATRETSRQAFTSVQQRLLFGVSEARDIVGKLWLWVLIGVGIGAIIHNYIPQATIESLIDTAGVFGVPLAVLLGVPLYGSSAAIVPIAVALFEKGVPLGTSLALMMAISALSLPEAVILRRAMRLKLIAIFFAVVAIGMVIGGYLFNAVEYLLI